MVKSARLLVTLLNIHKEKTHLTSFLTLKLSIFHEQMKLIKGVLLAYDGNTMFS